MKCYINISKAKQYPVSGPTLSAAGLKLKNFPPTPSPAPAQSESGCDFVEAVESWSPGLYPIGCAFRAYLSLCNTKCARLDETS